jgi:hypothetical protein
MMMDGRKTAVNNARKRGRKTGEGEERREEEATMAFPASSGTTRMCCMYVLHEYGASEGTHTHVSLSSFFLLHILRTSRVPFLLSLSLSGGNICYENQKESINKKMVTFTEKKYEQQESIILLREFLN